MSAVLVGVLLEVSVRVVVLAGSWPARSRC